jgi:hypothetical protein
VQAKGVTVPCVQFADLRDPGTNDYVPPEILNDQFFTTVDDSTVVID